MTRRRRPVKKRFTTYERSGEGISMRIERLGLLLAILSVFSAAARAGGVESSERIEMKLCECPYTEIAKRASIDTKLTFRLTTDERGKVVKLDEEPRARGAEAAIRLDDVRQCLVRWRLLPRATYTVVLRCDSLGADSYEVCENGKCLHLTLSRGWSVDAESGR